MNFRFPPSSAAWQHQTLRTGFEVTSFRELPRSGAVIHGCTTAVESGSVWFVEYDITVDTVWRTQLAVIRNVQENTERVMTLERRDQGWFVNEIAAPQLDDCLDVDLESSAVTNMLPVRRLDFSIGKETPAPAAYVRVDGVTVERLDQTYTWKNSENSDHVFAYNCPAFDFAADLTYGDDGLIRTYPQLATRMA